MARPPDSLQDGAVDHCPCFTNRSSDRVKSEPGHCYTGGPYRTHFVIPWLDPSCLFSVRYTMYLWRPLESSQKGKGKVFSCFLLTWPFSCFNSSPDPNKSFQGTINVVTPGIYKDLPLLSLSCSKQNRDIWSTFQGRKRRNFCDYNIFGHAFYL